MGNCTYSFAASEEDEKKIKKIVLNDFHVRFNNARSYDVIEVESCEIELVCKNMASEFGILEVKHDKFSTLIENVSNETEHQEPTRWTIPTHWTSNKKQSKPKEEPDMIGPPLSFEPSSVDVNEFFHPKYMHDLKKMFDQIDTSSIKEEKDPFADDYWLKDGKIYAKELRAPETSEPIDREKVKENLDKVNEIFKKIREDSKAREPYTTRVKEEFDKKEGV